MSKKKKDERQVILGMTAETPDDDNLWIDYKYQASW